MAVADNDTNMGVFWALKKKAYWAMMACVRQLSGNASVVGMRGGDHHFFKFVKGVGRVLP